MINVMVWLDEENILVGTVNATHASYVCIHNMWCVCMHVYHGVNLSISKPARIS